MNNEAPPKTHLTGAFKNVAMRLLGAMAVLVFGMPANAQSQPPKEEHCDEVLLFLKVEHLPTVEVPTFVCDRSIFLPVSEIFDLLKIKLDYSPDFKGYSGFISAPENPFEINFDQQKVSYKGQQHKLSSSGMISTPTELYLRSEYFGDIFDIEAQFNFRDLSVTLVPGFELPVLREQRLARMRSGINASSRGFDPDTVIEREQAFLHLSTADWGVNIIRQNNGMNSSRFQLALGGMLAGGELTALLNYNSYLPLEEKYQHYQWRYVDNDNAAIRQVRLGKIPLNSISTIFQPVLGAQVTNAPSYYRKSFGSYYLSDHTEPGWTVELYVNNLLIDYTKADASGYFEFDVPLMYGNSEVTLRYYGEWGEEHTSTRIFKVPFAFLPPGEMEYQASTGFVQDGKGTFVSQGRVNYGIARQVTLGGGVEYVSSPAQLPQVMPFLTSAISLAPGLMLNTEYVQGIRVKTLISYYTPSNLRLQVNYKRYNENQEAVRYNYDEEREVIVSMPYKFRKMQLFSRLAISHNKLNASDFTRAEMTLSGSSRGINANLTSFALMRENNNIQAYSTLSVSLSPSRGWALTPRVQYDYTEQRVRSARVEARKRIFSNGFVQASFEKQFILSSYYLQVGFRYDFSFARVGASLSHGKYFSSANISANGSLIHEPRVDYTDFSWHTHVNLASVAFRPFLDINSNGIRDTGEAPVKGLQVRLNGGRKVYREKDGTVIVTGLEAYRAYFAELNGLDFPYLAWQIDHTHIELYLSANRMKIIDVPVTVMGEASGMVYIQEQGAKKGMGRLQVEFYNEDSVLMGTQFTEQDGYFSYMELPPGDYTVQINASQLERLQMRATPPLMRFSIRGLEEGDMVDTLEFTLEPPVPELAEGRTEPGDTAPAALPSREIPGIAAGKSPKTEKEEELPGQQTEVRGDYKQGRNEAEPVFKVQLLTSTSRVPPDALMFQGLDEIEEYKHQGLFKYIYGHEKDLNEILRVKGEMRKQGFSGAFIVAFINEVRVSMDEAINVQNAGDLPLFENVIFKVQVLSKTEKLPEDHQWYNRPDPVEEYFHGRSYKYTFGHTGSLSKAILLQYQLRQDGFEGAFVVAFHKGKRISLEKALRTN